jgi:hypothetical protein
MKEQERILYERGMGIASTKREEVRSMQQYLHFDFQVTIKPIVLLLLFNFAFFSSTKFFKIRDPDMGPGGKNFEILSKIYFTGGLILDLGSRSESRSEIINMDLDCLTKAQNVLDPYRSGHTTVLF